VAQVGSTGPHGAQAGLTGPLVAQVGVRVGALKPHVALAGLPRPRAGVVKLREVWAPGQGEVPWRDGCADQTQGGSRD
jgi:hypothetical protein